MAKKKDPNARPSTGPFANDGWSTVDDDFARPLAERQAEYDDLMASVSLPSASSSSRKK